MEHLTADTLARLVDEAGNATEQAHLARCGTCRLELEALVAQTEALRALPALRPPPGDWELVRAGLEAEGLVEPDRARTLGGLASWATFRRVAAAVVIFASGIAVGAQNPAAVGEVDLARTGGEPVVTSSTTVPTTLEAALAQMEDDGLRYRESIRWVHSLREREGLRSSGSRDPVSYFAAYEGVLTTLRAALREIPTDPLMNQMYLHALEERDALAGRVTLVQAEESY